MGTASPFVALKNGMGRLVDTLERALPPDTVGYRQPAEQIATDEGGWHVISGESTLDARAVLFAAPASTLARLFAPLDAEVSRLSGEIPYVSTASVALAYPARAVNHPLDATGFVVARPAAGARRVRRHASALRITACTWASSKWEHRAPQGSVLLRAFLGGAHDPDVVTLGDDELAGTARRDLAGVLGIRGEPEMSRVYRWRNAGPQYSVGHLERVTALHDRLLRHRGFFVAGSGFHGVGIPDCISDAKRVAAQTIAFLRDHQV
jgi:oxygen-dependent protoporphyrinogen oxidase